MGDATADHTKLEDAWEQLMVKMVALRGDPDFEAFLTEKHPELATCAVPLDVSTGKPQSAPDGTTAAESRSSWFARKLKGDKGQKEKRHLIKGVAKSIRHFSEKYETPRDEGVSACEALKNGGAQEGPVICHKLAMGLVGTSFVGLRIAREGTGIYQLGNKPLRVAVQADLEGGELLVHGYFDGDVLHPVRVPVRAFLEEHGGAAPVDQGDMFGGNSTEEASKGDGGDRKRARELPPGWVKRESRSKPGVFYYLNEEKNLSQFEPPEA
mmetsp:Transcript_81866/g.228088  ORF Transcript_81866/g.228088 Transcript_81866/m.228088 type:complete len:268 (-) Transcript_81866:95-898(-)